MRKVFVYGGAMSGKNILRKMLDGHSGIVCSHVHDRVAFSLLSRPGAAYIKREWSENRKSFSNGLSSLEVLFESGDRSTSIYRKMGLVLPANNIHELIRETNEIVNNPEYRRLTIYKQRGAFENGLRLMGNHRYFSSTTSSFIVGLLNE